MRRKIVSMFLVVVMLVGMFAVAVPVNVSAEEPPSSSVGEIPGYTITQLSNNSYRDGSPQIHNGQVVWRGGDDHEEEIFFYDGTQTIQLTNNSYGDWPPQIHNGQVVWVGRDYGRRSYDIFLYDGTKVKQLTNNSFNYDPQIHNGQVVWYGSDGNDNEIFLYDGTKVKQLTNNGYHDFYPQIHNGQVVWRGYDGHDYEIFLYDGTKVKQLTNNGYNYHFPQIHNGQVVWYGSIGHGDEIFLYDGTQTIQLTDNSHTDRYPQIHNGQVVWLGSDGHDDEVFLYDGTKVKQLTNNIYRDFSPQIHNGQVVWEIRDYVLHNYEMFLYDGTKVKQLTNNSYTHEPQIHNGQVVWYGWDGNDFEIFLATPESGLIKNLDTNETFSKIQDAINDDDTEEGHTIEVSSGTFYENVKIDKSLILTGMGSSNTIIDGEGNGDVITIDSDGVTITGFTIQSGINGIHSNGKYKLDILDNKITNNQKEGIKFVNCGTNGFPIIISGNSIDNNTYNGIFLDNSNNIRINDNPSINDNGLDRTDFNLSPEHYHVCGIFLEDSENIVITDNTIQNNHFIGIWITGVSNNNKIDNNRINNNWDDGIGLEENIIINGGMRGDDNPEFPKNTIITKNYVYRNYHEGIHIYSGSKITIQNNYVFENHYDGVVFEPDTGQNVSVSSNQVYKNGQAGKIGYRNGIFIWSDRVVHVDTSNNIHDNPECGIFVTHHKDAESNIPHVVRGNKIHNNSKNGIEVSPYYGIGTSVNQVNIEVNQIHNNGEHGIFIESSEGIIIEDNNIQYSRIGVKLKDCPTIDKTIIIENNEIRYCDKAVYIDPIFNLIIRNNIIVHNEYGIYFEDSDDCIISGNLILENIYGIFMDEDSTGNIIYYNNFHQNIIQAEDLGNNIWDNGAGIGNFWSDYTGKDHGQDGIGDTNLPCHGLDWYPQMEPTMNVPPIADAGGPYAGGTGIALTFNAIGSFDHNDGDILEYRWDFDNDGVWDTGWSTDSTTTYIWDNEYSGNVVVEISDGEFTDTDTVIIEIKSVQAVIDYSPDTLNLLSKGKWISCYFELPEDYDVEDIDLDTILLNGVVSVEDKPIEIEDYDKDGIPDLMVKFKRADVQAILEVGEVEFLSVTGELIDGTSFGGSDTIRVIKEV